MSELATPMGRNWGRNLARTLRVVQSLPEPPVEGHLVRMVGLTLEAQGCQAAIGDRCDVMGGDGGFVEAEVVGFSADRLFLMPTGDIHGLRPGARVVPRTGASDVRVGMEMLGESSMAPAYLWMARAHWPVKGAHASRVRPSTP